MKSNSQRSKTLFLIAGGAYCLLLLYVLFLRRIGADYALTYSEYLIAASNLIPLKSVWILFTTPVISSSLVLRFLLNFFGNILLFIPWGILLPACFVKFRSFRPFAVLTLFVLVVVESIQLFAMLGSFDVEDILLNIIGALIGFGVIRDGFMSQKNHPCDSRD